MLCPTCDHKMRFTDAEADSRLYYCSRCGTLRIIDRYGDEENGSNIVPKLVELCRELETYKHFDAVETEWRTLGILEAIHKPEGRT